MVTSPPPPSRRRSSLLPFRPQTSQGLQSQSQSQPQPQPQPPSTSHSNVPPLPRSPSLEALRRLDQAFDHINQKRGCFEPGSSRWSTQFSSRNVYAIDTPEENLSVAQAEPSNQTISHAQLPPRQQQYQGHGNVNQQSITGRNRRESTSTISAGHSFLSQARSLVRRASTTLGGQPSHKHRRGSNQKLEIPEETAESTHPLQRPTTSYPSYNTGNPTHQKPSTSKRPSFLKRMRSFRNRRDAVSNAPGQNYPESTFPYPLLSNHSYSNQQIHQFDWPRPGAAARAAAAAASSASTMHLAAHLPAAGGRPSLLTRKDTKCSRTTRNSPSIDVEITKRADTAMEVDSVMEPAEKRSGMCVTQFPFKFYFRKFYRIGSISVMHAGSVTTQYATPSAAMASQWPWQCFDRLRVVVLRLWRAAGMLLLHWNVLRLEY